jgi:2-amino-4-hydroxy-6-hydroxymethyldihydropteridine diphosphokinase
VFLTLGSNIDPLQNLMSAVRALDAAVGVERVSRVYEAAPVGAPHTPTYLNAAVAIRTSLSPAALKREVLRPIEARLGRERTSDPNAARTIDIDIALVGDLVLREPGLQVPDRNIDRHAHLAFPLRDLDPDARHPLLDRSLAELAAALSTSEGIHVREDVDLGQVLEKP